MIRKMLMLVGFGAGMALLACTTDDATEKYPSADSFCTAKANEECVTSKLAEACSVANDRCKDQRLIACNKVTSAATSSGRTYRGSNVDACLQRLHEAYQDRVVSADKDKAATEACEKVFVGLKKKSETCTGLYDCEGTLTCDLEKGSVCAEKRTLAKDDPCNNPGEICGPGLYCQQRGGTKFCSDRNKEGDACKADAPCLEALRCAQTCVAKVDPGNPCDKNEDCKSSFCNTSKKCEAKKYAGDAFTCIDFGSTNP